MMVWDEATHQVRAYILRNWYLVHMIYRRMLLTTYQKVSDCTSSAPHGFLRAPFIERGRPERARGGHHQHFIVKRRSSAQKPCMVAGWLLVVGGCGLVSEWFTVGAWTSYSLNTNTTHQQNFIGKRWASWQIPCTYGGWV